MMTQKEIETSKSSLFKTWLKAIQSADKLVSVEGLNWRSICPSSGGITPDSIKFSPEYQQARIRFQIASDLVRAINKSAPKGYFSIRSKLRKEARKVGV